jgi:hypothetical protein
MSAGEWFCLHCQQMRVINAQIIGKREVTHRYRAIDLDRREPATERVVVVAGRELRGSKAGRSGTGSFTAWRQE